MRGRVAERLRQARAEAPQRSSLFQSPGNYGPVLRGAMRLLAIGLGACGLAFLLALSASIRAEWDNYAAWWTPIALGAHILVPVALLAAGLSGSMRAVHRAALYGSLILIAVLGLAGLAISPDPAFRDSAPWIVNLSALGSTVALLVLRRAAIVVAVFAVTILVGIVRFQASWGDGMLAAQNAIQTLSFAGVTALLVAALVRAGRLSDEASAAARSQAAVTVTLRAENDVRKRVEALVHDRVLATLLLAGRAATKEEHALAAKHARGALEALSQAASPFAAVEDLHMRDIAWSMQAIVRDMDPFIEFSYEISGNEKAFPRYDAEIVETIVAAALEALRNSLKHASWEDRETHRAVHLDLGIDHVRVTVLDDGVGFDPESISPRRLGIVSSIRSRMHSIGGRGTVISKPGNGTSVVLSWPVTPETPARQARSAAPSPAAAASSAATATPGAQASAPRGTPAGAPARPGPLMRQLQRARDAARRAIASGDAVRGAPARVASQRSGSWRARRPASSHDVLSGWIWQGPAGLLSQGPKITYMSLQGVASCFLAFTTANGHWPAWQTLVALAVFSVNLVLLAIPGGYPLRIDHAIGIVIGVCIVSVLNLSVLPHGAEPGYAAWYLGANMLTLLCLTLRGRIGMAWIGMCAIIVLTISWAMLTELPWHIAIGMLDRNTLTLMFGVIMTHLIERSVETTIEVEEALAAQFDAELAEGAATAERERLLARLERTATPALREIASGEPVPPERRVQWLALEAELRDRIRAPGLDADPLRSAVRRARTEGVRVVLLDDTDGARIRGDERERAWRWAAEMLDDSGDDEVTLRLRRVGTGLELTMVGDRSGSVALALPAEPAPDMIVP